MNDLNKNICNPKIFDEIFHRYAKDIKAFLYYKFQDAYKTDDVLQETFVKLWENCKKVVYTKVKSYLFTVANNLFLDIKRHEATVRNHEKTFVDNSKSESPEFLIIEKEFMTQLNDVLNRLPERAREIFLLNRIEKKKYREIAEMLDISVKTVEKHMHTAMVFLRKNLGHKI